MFIDRNLKRINIDAPYECEHGNRYANLRDPAIRDEHGIVEIPDPERKNEKFYFVQETVDAPYVINTPKDVEGLKSFLISEVKSTAGSLLAATDWKIVRAAEGIKPIDDKTLADRAAIRSASDSFEEEITAATTIEDLEAIGLTWSD